MPSFQDIRRRVKSVQNTKKITKAMEMVSAAKMRKAVERVLATRSYSRLAWEMLLDLSVRVDPNQHPLLHKRPVKKIGLILINSNRGLCGSFNHIVMKMAADYIKHHRRNDVEIVADIVLLGKKGRSIIHKYQHTVVAEFEKLDVTARLEEILPLSRLVIKDYERGIYDKIVIAYTDYVSAVKQVPRVRQILPITRQDENLGRVGIEREDVVEAKSEMKELNLDFIFEPSADQVLDYLMPRLIEMQIYQAVLESDASEHSARMVAMRNASDAANDMIDNLTFAYNQARQAAITSELADISGGRLALEN